MGRLRLSTVAPVDANHAMVRLGGISIYAASERILQEDLRLLGRTIVGQSAVLPSIQRQLLIKLVCKELGEEVEDRLFGAVLGGQMRMGLIDSIGCASINGKLFWVLINADSLPVFHERLFEVRDRLRKRQVMLVREVRAAYFPGDEWGTWSAANHLLARLTQIGCAEYIDKYRFAWPKGLESAFS